MNFQTGYIYHIYNQGNDGCKIFYNRENYLFFLRKIQTHLIPHLDIFAWCLMPNHFHIMALTRALDITIKDNPNRRSLNQSISILLRSYTRAINNQNKRTGSLFRAHTKAGCVNCPDGVTPSFLMENNITRINISIPEEQYPQVCFDYVHQNPVKAGLTRNPTEWEFSSALDYAGKRNGKLINRKWAQLYLNTNIE